MDPISNADLESASAFTIKEFNVNSIGRNPKRRQIFNALKKKDCDIYVLLDTRISPKIENLVKSEWGGPAFFSSHSSQSRGVAILIKKNFPIEILDKKQDIEGNFLSIKAKIYDKIIAINGIYGPNTDNPIFYKEVVFPTIKDWNPDYSIFTGDWNLVLNQKLDTYNYIHNNNPNATKFVKSAIDDHDLTEPWRYLNPDKNRFTWSKKNPRKMARLDYFLISTPLLPYISKTGIEAGIQSDHSITSLTIDFQKFIKGRGFWKFNNSLLKDPAHNKIVNDTIRSVTKQYATNPHDYDNDFWERADIKEFQYIQTTINPQLFFDTLLMEIRGETIKYGAKMKRDRNSKELFLSQQIELLEIKTNHDPLDATTEKLLEAAKAELNEINHIQAENASTRSRAIYSIHGEKPSRMFCNLTKNCGTQRFIPSLIVTKDNKTVLINNQKEIENEAEQFYTNLYKSKENERTTTIIEDYLGDDMENTPKLTEQEKQKIEGKITLEELTSYLKKTRNNVTPGSTGFTGDFYKFYFGPLKNRIIDSINYSFDINSISVSNKLGIITLIPKGDKDKNLLKNWRPLTLLSTYYKLISGCIAERLKPALNRIIGPEQKGYLPGRFIGEVTRTTYDIFSYAKNNNISGIILLIDFEKAFDSISFSYILDTLKFFNFGPDIIKWINLLLKDFKAVVNHAGNISNSFNILRGCRQGDPIAGYLFILGIEILSLKLKKSNTISGFQISNKRHILDNYADDLTIYLKKHQSNLDNDQNIRSAIKIISNFTLLSGLKVNIDKCQIAWFGADADSNVKLCDDLQIKWVKKI